MNQAHVQLSWLAAVWPALKDYVPLLAVLVAVVSQVVLVLGLRNDVDGVVGREHDAHVLVIVPLAYFVRQ